MTPAVASIERRLAELREHAERIRADELRKPGEDIGVYVERNRAWHNEWVETWDAIRDAERELADATPLSVPDTVKLLIGTLRTTAASRINLGRNFNMVDALREGYALENVATLIEDDPDFGRKLQGIFASDEAVVEEDINDALKPDVFPLGSESYAVQVEGRDLGAVQFSGVLERWMATDTRAELVGDRTGYPTKDEAVAAVVEALR
jgi:hypothetical protein